MSLDLRPPIASFFTAFAVAVTVTRPAPDNTPIATSGIWLTPLAETFPHGTDFQRRDPRRVMALRRSAVPTLPRGTVVSAPEVLSGANKTWRVDGFEQSADAEHWRAVVVLD